MAQAAVICVKCRAWACSNPRKLLSKCRGPTEAGMQALHRVFGKGENPNWRRNPKRCDGENLHRVVAVTPIDIEECSNAVAELRLQNRSQTDVRQVAVGDVGANSRTLVTNERLAAVANRIRQKSLGTD